MTKPTYREASYDGSGARPHIRAVVDPEDPEELDVPPDVEDGPQQVPHPGLGAVRALVQTTGVLLPWLDILPGNPCLLLPSFPISGPE